VRVTDDRRADTSLSKAIGQTARTVMTSVCSPFRSLPPLCLSVLRATRLVPVIGGDSAGSGCQVGRGARGSDTSQGRCGPNRMPSQANSVGPDRVLRSTADGVGYSRDAAADRCRHGIRPIYRAVPEPGKNRRLNLRDRSGRHTARAQTSLCPLRVCPDRRASRHQHADWPQQRL
jgi:hypothetical protein